MAQLICHGCYSPLMYIRGATSVQCSRCCTVTLALEGEDVIAEDMSLLGTLMFEKICCTIDVC